MNGSEVVGVEIDLDVPIYGAVIDFCNIELFMFVYNILAHKLCIVAVKMIIALCTVI